MSARSTRDRARSIPLPGDAVWRTGLAAEYERTRSGEPDSVAIQGIIGRLVGSGAVVTNIGVSRIVGVTTSAIYGIRYRPNREAHLAWGIEGRGTVDSEREHEVILCPYTEPGERFNIKIGGGMKFGTAKPAIVIRCGVVWGF